MKVYETMKTTTKVKEKMIMDKGNKKESNNDGREAAGNKVDENVTSRKVSKEKQESSIT